MSTQKPQIITYATKLNDAINAIRIANERLIKLSQRLGRLILKFQKVDHKKTGLFSWINEYSTIKDSINIADAELQKSFGELMPLINNGEVSFDIMNIVPYADYSTQRSRYYSKIEVLDDILSGLWEDVIDDIAFESLQDDMKKAMEKTMEKSKKKGMDVNPMFV